MAALQVITPTCSGTEAISTSKLRKAADGGKPKGMGDGDKLNCTGVCGPGTPGLTIPCVPKHRPGARTIGRTTGAGVVRHFAHNYPERRLFAGKPALAVRSLRVRIGPLGTRANCTSPGTPIILQSQTPGQTLARPRSGLVTGPGSPNDPTDLSPAMQQCAPTPPSEKRGRRRPRQPSPQGVCQRSVGSQLANHAVWEMLSVSAGRLRCNVALDLPLERALFRPRSSHGALIPCSSDLSHRKSQ